MSLKTASQNRASNFTFTNSRSGGGGGVGTGSVSISSIVVTDSGFNNLDDSAVGTSNSYIKIIGTGFSSSANVFVSGSQVSSVNVTYVNSTEIRVTLPSLSLGNTNIFVFNPDYSGAIWAPGITVSGFPDFTQTSYTSSTPLEVSVQLLATGDAPLTYALQAGSSLPSGCSLSSSGLITGTTTDGVYQFTVIVSDAQLQSFQYQITLTITSADEYFNRTVLAINGDVNAFVSDASTNSFPITINGDTKPSAFSPYNTNWSNFFDGTGDYLTFPELNISSSTSFTIEFWFYWSATPSSYSMFVSDDNGGSSKYIAYNVAGGTLDVQTGGGAGTVAYCSFTPILNTWYHLAFVRNTNTITIYVNGVAQAMTQATQSGTFLDQGTINYIGRWGGTTPYAVIGYMSNFRAVVGSAVYTSNFTPPTSSLTAISNTQLLTCQSNRLIDNSTNAFTITKNGDTKVSAFGPFTETDITTGSGYFDGTGDYLTIPYNSAWDFGTGNFTIETWLYPTTSGTARVIAASFINNGNDGWSWELTNGNLLTFYAESAFVATSSATVPVNTWTHVAVSRSGSTLKLFVNGVESASVSYSTSIAGFSGLLAISATQSATALYVGYQSNFRLVKGTAVYTTAFTPPASPLTAVANTSLLTLQGRQALNNHTFIDVSRNNNLITRTGNVSQGSFSPFSPAGWSNYFDGSGDYLTAPSNTAFTLGSSGDFTIECWFHLIASPSNYAPLMTTWTNSTNSYVNRWGITFYDGKLSWYTDAGNLGVADSSNIALNTWIHVAVVRNGSTITMYKNGVSLGTQTTAQAYTTDNALSIGYIAGGAYITGYISNARIVKGTAVYTSAFTPPTAALTAIANTSLLTCQSNRFKDNSTNNFTITKNGDTKVVNFSPFKPTAVYSPGTHGGSAYFDGTDDYLRATAQTFSGNFTLECWIYPLRLADTGNVGDIFATVSPNTQFYVNNNGQLGYYNTSTSTLSSANAIVTNTWQHIAICRSGTTTRLFVNGQVVATNSSDSGNRIFTDIGTFADGNAYYFQGYISDARWSSAALYTSAFTPPTAPLASISNTSFLLNFNNPAVIDVSSRNVMQTVGDAKIVTSTKKYGTGSMYFDGTGDYLAILNNNLLQFGTGNFTVEFWLNATNTGGTHGLVAASSTGTGYWASLIFQNSIYWQSVNGTTNLFSASYSSYYGSWTHVAFCRNNSVTKLYLNGIEVASASDTNNYNGTAGTYDVGRDLDNNGLLTGYIDDLRITRFARYTANFTPPTSTFLTQ